MVAFFPWASLREPLRFGAFHLVPLDQAVGSGDILPAMVDPVLAILAGYEKSRASARSVPVLRRDDVAMLATLTDEQVADYFGFRLRLAFATLASRRFFDFRYWNSDNLRLVIQAFDADRAGGALIQSRRRDGAVNTYVPKESMRVRRPLHVSSDCDLGRTIDRPLLDALETLEDARDTDGALAERLDDAVRLFVDANSDSPDVSEHGELVDLASAFGRLADADKEGPTVRDFVRLLPPPPPEMRHPSPGPRAADPRLRARTAGQPLRAVWLNDAILLRHHYGHGKVTAPRYKPIWSQREHLLLGALALPLAVKAVLRDAGHYTFTAADETLDLAFDDLALLTPFAPAATTQPSEPSDPWNDVLAIAQVRVHFGEAANAPDRALESAAADGDDRASGDGPADANDGEPSAGPGA